MQALFNGDLILADKQFALLNEWKAYAELKFAEIKAVVRHFVADLEAAWNYAKHVAEGF